MTNSAGCRDEQGFYGFGGGGKPLRRGKMGNSALSPILLGLVYQAIWFVALPALSDPIANRLCF
ncbi:hypothetical protein C4D60_Mb02t08510 [Musa balbisiana]|uniref:Uncharacterized protein n=1 Tax=Musa balbisiana TaxID=52838 RepID=A0A4S8I989_MUSBA|nr:hypothetical protein C4D60_Mb02t08510 [Musa balbisiana]